MWQIVLIILLLGLVAGLYLYVSKRSNLAQKSMLETNLENTRWANTTEINARCRRVEFAKLETAEDGIVIKARQGTHILNNKKLYINMAKPIHTLIVGASGSGKTSTFVSPSIEILQRTKTKPSMVIADPKGELYAMHAQGLRESGYTVHVINLREPYKSTRWNPLSVVWDKYELSKNGQVEGRGGSYWFGHLKFSKFEDAEVAKLSRQQQLQDECYDDLNEIASALCPANPNEKDPIWRNGAKAFLHGMLLAMLEDGQMGAMSREAYTFGNLYNNLSRYLVGECEELKRYFLLRPMSKCVGLVNQVLESPINQMKSYLSSVIDAMSIFADSGLCALTSENEIDFESFDEKPTVMFLIIPDERTTRYKLATMLVNKLYSELVGKANKNLDNKKTEQTTAQLKRNLYFLIDEFANLPKIEQMDTKITAARSRKIWFVLIIQSYAQLRNVYGREVADIIMGNCDINMFIGTTDQDTLESFSKRIGNKKISQKSMSRGSGSSVNESFSVSTRPLMYPRELGELNGQGKYGNTIVLLRGDKPIKSKFIQAHTATQWQLSMPDSVGLQARLYKRLEYDYNFKSRNDFIEEMLDMDDDEVSKNSHAEMKDKDIMENKSVGNNIIQFDKNKVLNDIPKGLDYEEYDLTSISKNDSLEFLEEFGLDESMSKDEILVIFTRRIKQAGKRQKVIELAKLISAKLRYLAIMGEDE